MKVKEVAIRHISNKEVKQFNLEGLYDDYFKNEIVMVHNGQGLAYTGFESKLGNPFYETCKGDPLEAVKRFRETLFSDIKYFQDYGTPTKLLLQVYKIAQIMKSGEYQDSICERLVIATYAKCEEEDHAVVIAKCAKWMIDEGIEIKPKNELAEKQVKVFSK